MLSGINTTIVRVREEEELFREACRIAVEHGRFVFAWIGKFDADSQQVTPVAQAGRDDGYLAQINLTARADTPNSCALTAQALTEAKPVICNDIASDERMADWRSEALEPWLPFSGRASPHDRAEAGRRVRALRPGAGCFRR